MSIVEKKEGNNLYNFVSKDCAYNFLLFSHDILY